MAIERKAGGYVYRKTRHGRRIVSEYLGKGAYADTLVGLATVERQQQEQQRAAWVAERATIEAADALCDELASVVHDLLTAILTEAGYHQHKRQWRKRRDEYYGRE